MVNPVWPNAAAAAAGGVEGSREPLRYVLLLTMVGREWALQEFAEKLQPIPIQLRIPRHVRILAINPEAI
jgi:hypothetical protein